MLCDAQSQHIRTPVPDAYRDDPADAVLIGVDGRMKDLGVDGPVRWYLVVYEQQPSICARESRSGRAGASQDASGPSTAAQTNGAGPGLALRGLGERRAGGNGVARDGCSLNAARVSPTIRLSESIARTGRASGVWPGLSRSGIPQSCKLHAATEEGTGAARRRSLPDLTLGKETRVEMTIVPIWALPTPEMKVEMEVDSGGTRPSTLHVGREDTRVEAKTHRRRHGCLLHHPLVLGLVACSLSATQAQHMLPLVPDAYREASSDADLVGVDGTRICDGRSVDPENVVLAVTAVVRAAGENLCGDKWKRKGSFAAGRRLVPAPASSPKYPPLPRLRRSRRPPWMARTSMTPSDAKSRRGACGTVAGFRALDSLVSEAA
ncbi:hypothetical protein HMN09_01404800 [Mycena chlorophos]|uniref:Uncharacterized protein n=1 Tax=Mycena chlorophos TaxID=658473 RepID=A0A8H6RVX4_MYCCL|nr:hypothetical protein HMN09_01404800 [Mycena chlorophos]